MRSGAGNLQENVWMGYGGHGKSGSRSRSRTEGIKESNEYKSVPDSEKMKMVNSKATTNKNL